MKQFDTQDYEKRIDDLEAENNDLIEEGIETRKKLFSFQNAYWEQCRMYRSLEKELETMTEDRDSEQRWAEEYHNLAVSQSIDLKFANGIINEIIAIRNCTSKTPWNNCKQPENLAHFNKHNDAEDALLLSWRNKCYQKT